MALKAELRINLASLKRQDPYIGNITDSSTHVAVYSFSPQSNEWEKTDVEGTLFVYKRVAPPYWGFTILNRLSMENLTEPLTSELEFQTQNPFLLYRNAKLLIYGIWFYDQDDCKRIGELLEKLCRESTQLPANDPKAQKVNIFGLMDNFNNGIKETIPKPSSSPTSNSVNSISPGSSVGGVQRPASNNEEADSEESEDKEIAQTTNKGSIDIMDLLFKAQDKYEKEKRNTPDPIIDGMQNGIIISPTDAELQIVKPVPMKPTHPQKLDVATLFKQQPPKPPEASAVNNSQPNPVAPTVLPPTMNAPFVGILPQQMAAIPTPSASVNIPTQQQQRRQRPIGRSFSMTEMAMRQHLDAYMNGNVMSVEEVEASMNRGSTANRQQQVNSTLDRMIDRINSGGGVSSTTPTGIAQGGGISATTPTGIAQTPQLPGIKESLSNSLPTVPKTLTGNSGSVVVNGNHPVYHGDNDTFAKESTVHPFAGNLILAVQPTFGKQPSTPRQRSISTSGVQVTRPHFIGGTAPPVPTNAQFTPSFSIVPNQLTAQPNLNVAVPNSITVPLKPTTTSTSAIFPAVSQSTESSLLLHGKAVVSEKSSYNLPNPIISAITTAVSTIKVNDQINKVPLTTTIMPQVSKSSPALATTLISPEDFERSTTTPQKKLELKQRLLQEPQQNVATAPLTKQQLQQTLVSLLQKDSSFLAAIHTAYMTNFKQT